MKKPGKSFVLTPVEEQHFYQSCRSLPRNYTKNVAKESLKNL